MHRPPMPNGKAVIAYPVKGALDLDEGVAASLYNLGISYERLGRMDAAVDAYNRAATLEPSDTRYSAAANAIAKKSQRIDAI